ncbi:MAG: aminotransferase class V-fold PLP-dependent enzyme [Planctomycetota bacterium]
MQRIYLDNAATSWPKPPAVYEAIDRYQRDIGAAAGRAGYDSASQAASIVTAARVAVARQIGAGDPSRVVFSASGTESLNLAIQGLLRPGDHVVTTVCEHNSVLRPLAMLREAGGVTVNYVGCDAAGVVDPSEVEAAITPSTRLVAVTAASNVTGALQPIEPIGELCRRRGVSFLVDAAQVLGHTEIDVQASHISLLASPGHKGLLGPLGTGFLYVSEGLEESLHPLLHGGTGINSDKESPPAKLPARYEAGNLNVPALAGLEAGIRQLPPAIKAPLEAITQRVVAELSDMPKVQVFGPPAGVERAPVVGFRVEGYDPHDAAAVLAASGIECRAGLHCAPRMHKALGTAECGGAVRISPGHATTDDEIDQTIQQVRSLADTTG